MSAKEKANELIEKYLKLEIEIGGKHDGYLKMKMHEAKQCALIAVDEVLEILWHTHNNKSEYRFWQQVKTEIGNL